MSRAIIIALLAAQSSACGLRHYLCPSGADLRSVEVDVTGVDTDDPEVRTLARMSVCGLPIVVETSASQGVATVCVEAPIIGVRCKEIVQ